MGRLARAACGLTTFAVLAGGLGPSALAAAPARSSEVRPLRAADEAAVQERWGIQVQGISLTAGGYMLDFRYRVVDAVKAAPLFDRRTRPVLTDETTGAVMAVPVPPKTGPLRSSNDPKVGRVYFMFFANPRQFVARYSRVTVTIGEFSISGLTVK